MLANTTVSTEHSAQGKNPDWGSEKTRLEIKQTKTYKEHLEAHQPINLADKWQRSTKPKKIMHCNVLAQLEKRRRKLEAADGARRPQISDASSALGFISKQCDAAARWPPAEAADTFYTTAGRLARFRWFSGSGNCNTAVHLPRGRSLCKVIQRS